jgi:hypothetical protein
MRLFVEVVEQLAFIGLVEEFFPRGYLMGGSREWLGDLHGDAPVYRRVLFGSRGLSFHKIWFYSSRGSDGWVPVFNGRVDARIHLFAGWGYYTGPDTPYIPQYSSLKALNLQRIQKLLPFFRLK